APAPRASASSPLSPWFPAGSALKSREGVHVARVVEVYELFQALDVTIVEELFLEVRSRSIGAARALCRYHRHVASRRCLHSTVLLWCVLSPTLVGAGPSTETASQEFAQSQISIAKAQGIGGEPVGIRLGLIVEGIPGI